jgi:hypothetical protein
LNLDPFATTDHRRTETRFSRYVPFPVMTPHARDLRKSALAYRASTVETRA